MTIIKRPEDLRQSGIRKFMVFGSDIGLIEDTVEECIGWFLINNPKFEVRRFSEDDISANFASFENSISSDSLFGHAAVGVVRLHSESVANKLAHFVLENNQIGGALFVIGIGLSPKGQLVTAFEKASQALVLRTFEASVPDLVKVAKNICQTEHVSIDSETIKMIIEATVKDTLSVKSQFETLCLYTGRGGSLDFETAHRILIDNKDGALDDLINSTFEGRLALALENAFFCLRDGESPIRILNLLIMRAKLLFNLIGLLNDNVSASQLVKEKRFGIFWKQQSSVANQIDIWAKRRLDIAIRDLIEIDAKCKARGGSIAHNLLVERGIMRIAQLCSGIG